jgi:hypothetical protein
MSRQLWWVAAIIAVGGNGCTPARAGTEAREGVHAAVTGALRARACAAELWRAADLDPEATARLLAVEPAALAPWGGAAKGKQTVREVILARAASVQDDASAARSLSLLGEYASAEQQALRDQKIARSVAASAALCAAADGARTGLLARAQVAP